MNSSESSVIAGLNRWLWSLPAFTFAVFGGGIGFLLLIGFYVLIGTTLVTAVNHAIVGAAGVLVGAYVLRKFTPEWWFTKY